MTHIRCNHCYHIQSDEELLIVDDKEACVNCQKTDALMDIEVVEKQGCTLSCQLADGHNGECLTS